MSRSGGFTIQQIGRAGDIGRTDWDALSAGRPFASYRWTRFGETVMSDCSPTYLILHFDNQPAARATFWRVAAEPLPLPPLVRTPVSALLRRRPLLICRAPLANWTGLLLPDDPSLRSAARTALHAEGLRLLEEARGSYLLFDFLDAPDLAWPADVTVTTVSDPGTRLDIRWKSFNEYLASTDKRGRQHFKRVQHEAGKLGLQISEHPSVANVDEAMPLIRAVERKFHAASNPWMRSLLENADQVCGIWLEVRLGERLVGCGLLLEDNGVLLAAALGLAEGVQYAYFLLVYACLQIAIQRQVKTLRLGSGAYDVKRHLGCELETNNHTAVAAYSPMLRRLANWLG